MGAQVCPCDRAAHISVDRGKPSQAACAQTMGLICSYESYDFFSPLSSIPPAREKDELEAGGQWASLTSARWECLIAMPSFLIPAIDEIS